MPRADFTPLLDALGRRRHLLLVLYGVVFVAWAAVTSVATIWYVPEVFHAALDTGEAGVDFDQMPPGFGVPVVVLVLVAQLVFVAGAGSVRVGRRGVRLARRVLVTLVFATVMTILVGGLIVSFSEMLIRVIGEDRWHLLRGASEEFPLFAFARALAPVLLASWLLWLALAWVLTRSDPRTWLARLTAILFTGSWVEFALVLPIEWGTRARTKDCPCVSGSWTMLVLCVPILIWIIGPALYVLYRREAARASADPDRPTRILLDKTRPPGAR